MNHPRKNSPPLTKLAFGLLLLTFVLLTFTDFNDILNVLSGLNQGYILLAVLATIGSLIAAAWAFVMVNESFGIRIGRKKLFQVGIATIAFNNLITLGGTVGHSLRIVLMKDTNVRTRDILSASFFFSYLNLMAITAFLPLSLTFSLIGHHIPEQAVAPFQISLALFLGFAALLSLLIFLDNFRATFFHFLSGLIGVFLGNSSAEKFQAIDSSLSHGVAELKRSPFSFSLLLVAILIDWIFCLIVLWAIFKAVGISLFPPLIFSGFFLSVTAGLVSMLPGGLGVQDISQSSIYHFFGVSIPVSVSIDILFRAVYYLLPFLLGLVIYWHFIRNKEQHP